MLLHFNDTRMGIQVGDPFLGTGTAIRTFLKKSFLVLMHDQISIDLCKQKIVKHVCLIWNVVY